MIAMAALRYFILKVDPKKKMIFNPQESVDLQGNTGPFIQYSHARIASILRKANMDKSWLQARGNEIELNLKELELLRSLHEYPEVVKEAAKAYSPALIANFVYELAKKYNQFFHDYSVLNEENEPVRNFRIRLSYVCGRTIRSAMSLLCIEVPERM
jgi:arginyl-tRNA synthetase